MSVTLDCFCLITPVRMPCAYLLSNCIGVGPCGCPISVAVWCIGSDSLALMQPPPVSDSFVELITVSMTFLRTRTGWLCFGGGSSYCMGILGLLLN